MWKVEHGSFSAESRDGYTKRAERGVPCFLSKYCDTVMQWLALSPYSEKVLGTIPVLLHGVILR